MDVSTRQQLWKDMSGNLIEKEAELNNTYDMPGQAPPSKKHDRPTEKATIKNASAPMSSEQMEDLILKEAFGNQMESPTNTGPDGAPDDNEEHAMPEQPRNSPQAKALKPRVDVSGKEPPKVVVQKTAQHYALPSLQQYPLDGYDEVEKAASYFDKWYRRMDPGMRREFCQNMVKRAEALSISTSDLAQRYASDRWAPEEQVKIALDARRSIILDEDQLLMLDKVAEQRRLMTPEDFAILLGEFDKVAGINHHYDTDIPDPFFSCFAKTANKAESETSPDESIIVGNEYLPTRKLVQFSNMGFKQMQQRFGEELAREFQKDPQAIFNSMPRDQKLVIMRMANNNESAHQGASTS